MKKQVFISCFHVSFVSVRGFILEIRNLIPTNLIGQFKLACTKIISEHLRFLRAERSPWSVLLAYSTSKVYLSYTGKLSICNTSAAKLYYTLVKAPFMLI